MIRTRRTFYSFLSLLAFLLVVPVVLTWRVVRQEQLNRALIAAVKSNDAKAIVPLLLTGADPNAREVSRAPHSWWRLLLYCLHDRHSVANRAPTALMMAASNDLDTCVIIRVLLNGGANPNCQDNLGRTALMFAAIYHPLCVTDLLDKGANVNSKDDLGNTALMDAVIMNPQLTQLLLDRGADVNAKDKAGRTALMRHLESDSHSYQAAQLLLHQGAAVNVKDAYGRPLLLYTQYWAVKLVLDKGADANAADREGWTALMQAAYHDDTEAVRALLSHGANVKAKDKKGHTALKVARRYQSIATIRLLRAAGAQE